MNKELNNIVEQIMERICTIQLHIDSIDLAKNYLYRTNGASCIIDCGNIREQLIDEELREWRRVFMFAMVLDGETLKSIKKAAYNRFLDDRNDLSDITIDIDLSSTLRNLYVGNT